MSLYRKICTAMIAACVVTTMAACKQAHSETPKVETLSFPTDVAVLDSSLNMRLGEFEDTFNNGQIAKLLDFTPPDIVNKILIMGNVSRAELDAQVDKVWEQTLQIVEVGEFTIDETASPIQFLEEGRPYKILPPSTTMKIKANGSEIVSKSETLALIENDKWYVIRLDDPSQVKIFRDAYPDFDDIQVMDPIMTMDGEEITP